MRSAPAWIVVLASVILGLSPRGALASPGTPLLRAQVLLDRAGFSPGEIDGHGGPNTTRALEAFQRAKGLPVSGRADARTLEALGGASAGDVIAERTLTEEDVAGPWTQVPEDLMAQAMLPALGYTSPLERLAEQVHASPALLHALNPEASFDRVGEVVRVPAVALDRDPRPAVGTSGTSGTNAARSGDVIVHVSRSASALTVTDAQGRVVMHAPVTVGSEHDPLPIGQWHVTAVQREPVFHYNPELFWDADPAHAKAVLKAGPNNPVGAVWIDIDREHYGLHGTPEPSHVGHTASHGCVRLTNWDALRLASLVARGTRVSFEE